MTNEQRSTGCKRWGLATLMALVACCGLSTARAASHALLVGIGAYQDPDVPRLAGTAHDVAALRDVLQRRWGFRAGDIRSLLDGQATKARILAELDDLARRGSPGDEVLIYFSGHGSSRLDAGLDSAPVPHGSGALIAHDFSADPARMARGEGLVIGRHYLVPRILALEAAGRRLWVVMDTCYSGQAVREATGATRRSELPKRAIALSRPNAADALAQLQQRIGNRTAPPPYPYQATAFLSAADEGETARDIDGPWLRYLPTLDGKPHGAFTDALLRVLEGQLPADLNADGRLDLNEVHRAVSDFMATRPYAHTPQRLPALAEDRNNLSGRRVLAMEGAAAKADTQRRDPPPLPVSLESLPPALASRLAGLPGVRAAKASERPGLSVAPSSADPALLDVVDAAGDLLRRLPAQQVDTLATLVRQHAWLHRWRALLPQWQRGGLPMSLGPLGSSGSGANYFIGDRLEVALRPDAQAWVALLALDADGSLDLLYPTQRHETLPRPANSLLRVPADSAPLKVRGPLGKDLLIGLAFDRDLTRELLELATYTGPRADGLPAALERLAAREAGAFTAGWTEFRTVAKP
jgi:uncharacterized caspase-like protein